MSWSCPPTRTPTGCLPARCRPPAGSSSGRVSLPWWSSWPVDRGEGWRGGASRSKAPRWFRFSNQSRRGGHAPRRQARLRHRGSDREGRADVPVEVPPQALARAWRARSNRIPAQPRETEVDLQLPVFPRIAVVGPPRLEAGSFAEVAVFAVEPDGTPSPPSSLDIRSPSDALVQRGSGRRTVTKPGSARSSGIVRSGPVDIAATATGPPPARSEWVEARAGRSLLSWP